MEKCIVMLYFLCVMIVALPGQVVQHDDVKLRSINVSQDATVQPSHTSNTQVTETASPVQGDETVHTDSSLSTSLPADQSESGSIRDAPHSSAQIKSHFIEVRETSQTEDPATESVTQSTIVELSEVISSSQSVDSGINGKTSIQVPLHVEDGVGADEQEVKVTLTQEAVREKDPSVNISQYKDTGDQQEEVVATEPASVAPITGQPGVGEVTDEKPGEGELTFNEWTQKVRLAEAEKGKKEAQDDSENVALPAVKQRKKKNYASHECGAKVLSSNSEATNPKSVLNSNRDEYMNNPCKTNKKWFVIELCEPIQTHSVDIASLELFSSQPKQFKVYLSDRYPTKDWKLAGEFDTKDERAIQTFAITEAHDYFAKFVRVELLDHYGNEHFCPLTIFRVLGIAVVDYEDDHHDESADDDDDDDDVQHGDSESSSNLFTSAKDTVINIVKKVLNVNSDEDILINNVTQPNATHMTENSTVNDTASVAEETTYPCVPDANIVTDKDTAKKDGIQQDKVLPQIPTPSKTDRVIVVKLEDDEQMETSPDATPAISLHAHIQACSHVTELLEKTNRSHCIIQSNLCQFVYLIAKQSPTELLSKTRTKKNSQCAQIGVDEFQNVVTTKTELVSTNKQDTDTDTAVPVDAAGANLIEDVSSAMDAVSEFSTSFSESAGRILLESKHMSDSSHDMTVVNSESSETVETSQTASSNSIQPTPTADVTAQTATQILSSTKTVDSVAIPETGFITSSVVKREELSESEKIKPSPTSVETQRKVTVDSSREATPTLPESWKPDTKDLMEDRTVAERPKSTERASTEMDCKQMKPATSSVMVQSPDTSVISASAADTAPHTDNADVGLNVVSLDDAAVDLGALETKTTDNTQGQKPNTTVIDGKVVVGNGGQQKHENLSLVRVPIIPSGKRESLIMRLSNRLKVLEQNVSLSSRFLEELSQRYKKQSEDMMKMLNKTTASLQNVTVEADVKNKLHEDEMWTMEQRLENLTQIVHQLTHHFNNLNRQVTDRQMIWTSIEIVIIIFIVLFLHFHRKRVTLPPEVKTLIESMPGRATNPLPQRRNSLSGPATPSKEKPFGDLHSGGGLHRFSSETALVSADKDFQADVTNKQATDGVKKRKKKKHKNLESRSTFSNTGGPFQWENSMPQTSSQQSSKFSMDASQQSNQSKEETSQHSSCSMLQTQSNCFGSLLRGWSNTSTENQRSASLGTEVEVATMQCTAAGSSSHQGGLDAVNDCLGTKNGTSVLVKKHPVPGGSKVSPKMNIKCLQKSESGGTNDMFYRNEMTLEEKWVTKGHKRQKSLPKQQYSSVQTVGQVNYDSANKIDKGTQYLDTNPVTSKTKKCELKQSVTLPIHPLRKPVRLPTGSYSSANGHGEYDELMFAQMDNYSVANTRSEIFCSSKNERNVYNSECTINWHMNGDDYNDNTNFYNQYSSELDTYCSDDIHALSEPQVAEQTVVLKSRQNGAWKNIFGYFK